MCEVPLTREEVDAMITERLLAFRRKLLMDGNLLPSERPQYGYPSRGPAPTIEQMAGSDPNFTGEETTAEYLREIGKAGDERR